MIDDKTNFKIPHNIILENRKQLSVSGVKDILRFDESTICLVTSLGELTIAGENLHISKTNVETGELNVDGLICELVYSAKAQPRNSIFSKMFKQG